MHVLQFGTDAALILEDGDGEALDRQLSYARELALRVPTGRVSILVLAAIESAVHRRLENLEIIGVPCRGYKRLWHIARHMAAIHRSTPVDLITVQNVWDENSWLALLFSRLWRIPCIAQIHTDCFSAEFEREFARGATGVVRQWIWPRLLPAYSGFRTVGERIKASLVRRGITANRVAVVPVPMQIITEAKRTAGMGRRPEVLFVGRLVEQKNLPGWLAVAEAVAARVPQSQFVLVGSGPELEQLKQHVAALGLQARFSFAGYVEHSKLSEYYLRASVFLLTSFHEGFGRVIAEALSHELPCVATRVAGVEDIIVDGATGFLHGINDTEAMADSVCNLLLNRTLCDQMGRLGRYSVKERFAPAVLTQQWVALWLAAVRREPLDQP